MTDVLLTHSNHLPNDAKQMNKMQPYPPLGTLYAATALRAAGFSVSVFDATFAAPIAGFVDSLERHQPKIVVIYEDDFNFVTKMCLAHMRELASEMSSTAHARDIPVIVHGSDATDHPQEYFKRGADYVLNGEAESTLTDLCAALLQSRAPAGIPGLVSARSPRTKPQRSAGSPRNASWVDLPRVARDLIDLEPYRQAWIDKHGYFSANVVSSRGCPYRCNWCAKPISGDKFNLRRPEDVAAEVRSLRDEHGVQHIWFSDDVFALSHRWVQEFADAVEAGGDAVPFKVQSRADLMSEATVTDLKRAGCAEIWMGVESGSQKILDAMGKGLKLSAVHSARERLAAANIRACYFLQMGYPGEGWREICDTVQLVRDTRPDDIGVSVAYPLPGTAFYDRVQAQLGKKRNWTDSGDLCAIFTAEYTDEFYYAVRDALHAEVTGWNSVPASDPSTPSRELLWRRVDDLEPVSHHPDTLSLPPNRFPESSHIAFMPLADLAMGTGGA